MKHVALLLSLVCGMAGCSPATYELHGKVTLDKTPIADAQIQFVPSDPALGPLFTRGSQDGTYRITLPRGDYTIRILAQKSVPPPPGTIGPGGQPLKAITVDVVPQKYNVKSELRTAVTEAAELNLELKSESP